MRIAEFVNMTQEDVKDAIQRFDVAIDEEGQKPYDYDRDSGTAALMQELMLDVVQGVDDKMSPPAIVRMVGGKAFRIGCAYGRQVVAPEKRDES